MKKCSKCKITKPSSEFHKDQSRSNNISYCCRLCRHSYHLLRRDRPPGLIGSPSQKDINSLKNLVGETPESAYVLGMIWADGYFMNHTARFSIECVKKDIDKIKPIFLKTGDWLYSSRTRDGRKPQATLYIKNRAFHAWMINKDFHIKQYASPAKVIDGIPDKLRGFWWRGYFDGDGNFYYNKKIKQLSFSSSYEQDWSFMSMLSDGNISRIKRNNGHSHSSWRTGKKKNIIHAYNLMYGQGNLGIGLDRKRVKMEECMEILND